MDALVMAGGRGSRLKMGEKPLVNLFGRPLIDYVVLALEESLVDRIFISTTENVPSTKKWAEERDLYVLETGSYGYVPDMIEAVIKSGVKHPIMVIMADLPLVTPDIIDQIIEAYKERPEPALSTHTPLSLHNRLGRRPDSLFNYRGQLIVPAGINVLKGSEIDKEQEDFHLILERMELAVNVNVPEDLMLCEKIMQGDIL